MTSLPPIAVVTVVAGRHAHLRAQRALLPSVPVPAGRSLVHVVVALADPGVAPVLAEQADLPTELVTLAATPAGLPVAAARNAGAAAALARGADPLVFLDVDCLPGPDLLTGYAAALDADPGAVICGPVTYLPLTPPGGWDAAALAAARAPHPARPDPPRGTTEPLAPTLFWSLSFATSAAAWQRTGGFDEAYEGYGGEDTDFGLRAWAAGVRLTWVGGAVGYHQHHPVSAPPVEHLEDILRNGAQFARRWGWWPMTGWLTAFEQRGLVERSAGGWVRTGEPVEQPGEVR